ncbi:MAG: hypothetical protein DRJ65_09725 [Acidobacteria bacterium]|nr:MAG: hypothetical protein DRJ65_09725 [Acidobacteriota bacterium]
MRPRRVLILSYYFAPTPSAGAVRMGGLVKYLPSEGWQTTVVTPGHTGRSPEMPDIVETGDADMAASIKRALGLDGGAALKDLLSGGAKAPGSGLRLKARLIDTFKGLVAFPDTNRGWISIAAESARKTIAEQSFDLVLTTSPPPSAHVAGRRIQVAAGLPWVADLRDLWSDDRFSTAPGWRRAIDRRFEQRTLGKADALVTVSEPLAEELRALHPGVPTHTVLNGFDPDLVNPGEPLPDVFTITHTGTYHQGRRDPSLLFEAAGNLIRRGRLPRDRFRIRLFVKHEPWLLAMAERHGVADIVESVPWGSFEEAIRAQRTSHVLLLLHWGGPREAGVVTAKVFEYLAAQRPILVLGGGPGVLRDLLDDTGGGLQVNAVERLEEQLLLWWEEFEQTGTIAWQGEPERIERYSHIRMAREFASVFERALEG